MTLRDQILKEHTKANCNAIVKWISDSQKRFDELFKLFLSDEYRIAQRAAWPLSYAAVANPKFIQKHFAELLKNLEKPNLHPAVKRNTVRLLQDISIPKKFHGRVMNLCFDYINSPGEAAAVKAFSLTILENLSRQYPEIKAELRTVIEDRWHFESAAFHARARKILERL